VEGDRRAKRIELTEEAQAQVKQLQEITQAIRAELLQKIDQKSLETALTVLQEISQTVEATLADKDR
jgi:MarR family transcriptional regulator for hemolysin